MITPGARETGVGNDCMITPGARETGRDHAIVPGPDEELRRGGSRVSEILPVASAAQVRAYARRLTLRYPRDLGLALGAHGLAAVCGLATPRLLGALVEDVRNGAT